MNGEETTGPNWSILFDGEVRWNCSFTISKEKGFAFNTLEPVEIILKTAETVFKMPIQTRIRDIRCHTGGLNTTVEISGVSHGREG